MSVAGVAHPVERHLAKVEVASSSLVTRSIKKKPRLLSWFLFLSGRKEKARRYKCNSPVDCCSMRARPHRHLNRHTFPCADANEPRHPPYSPKCQKAAAFKRNQQFFHRLFSFAGHLWAVLCISPAGGSKIPKASARQLPVLPAKAPTERLHWKHK